MAALTGTVGLFGFFFYLWGLSLLIAPVVQEEFA